MGTTLCCLTLPRGYRGPWRHLSHVAHGAELAGAEAVINIRKDKKLHKNTHVIVTDRGLARNSVSTVLTL